MIGPTGSGWTAVRSRTVAVPQHVVYRELAEETVLLNIETGRYHGIDAIGGRFFATMLTTPDLAAAAAALAAEFQQPLERIETDLAAFCARLHELGLIELNAER